MASSKRLFATLTPKMTELGYTFFKNSMINEIGMYCKPLNNGLYLSLVLIDHRFENDVFTADFYCSRHTGYCNFFGVMKDSEHAIGTRVGDITTGRDFWWDKESTLSICDFAQSVEKAEGQFLKDFEYLYIPFIDQDINEIHKLEIIEKTTQIVNDNLINESMTFTVNKEMNGIPIQWFHAAEIALTERWIKENIPLFAIKKGLLLHPLEEITKGKVMKNVIVDFASDAYRLCILKAVK